MHNKRFIPSRLNGRTHQHFTEVGNVTHLPKKQYCNLVRDNQRNRKAR